MPPMQYMCCVCVVLLVFLCCSGSYRFTFVCLRSSCLCCIRVLVVRFACFAFVLFLLLGCVVGVVVALVLASVDSASVWLWWCWCSSARSSSDSVDEPLLALICSVEQASSSPDRLEFSSSPLETSKLLLPVEFSGS